MAIFKFFVTISIVVIVSQFENISAQYDSSVYPPYLATSASCDRTGYSNIMNKRVAKVEFWTRPLSKSRRRKRDFRGLSEGIKHAAVVAITTDGRRYLVHKGNGYGDWGQTVVSCSSVMQNNNWTKKRGPKKVSGNKNLYDYTRAGGRQYNLLTNNCQHAANRMYDLN